MAAPRTRRSSLLLATLLLPPLAACDPAPPSSAGPRTALLDAGSYPCTLRFEPTGVVLRSDAAGSVPDPGPWVDVFPDGRFVTSSPQGGSVLVWSPEGRFLNRVGRQGEGPGEMGQGVYPRVGPDGTLHTIDISQMRWSRFTPDGTFISSATSPHFRTGLISLAVLGNDSLLTLEAPEPSEHTFHVVDGSGRLLRSFGERPQGLQEQRSITLTRTGTVWIGPVYGSPSYALEEWSLDGRLIRRIDREVAWRSRIADRAPAPPSEGDLPRYPLSIRINAGANGLLMVAAFNWGLNDPVPGPVHLEVIDPDGPTVLASQTLDPALQPPPFFLSAPEPNSAYRRNRDHLDLASIEMLRYHLDPASDASPTDAARCAL